MKTEILLDREGDLPVPSGVQVIESEVDFLRFALTEQSLLIRGVRLCEWAESFYNLRGNPVRVVESPSSALRHVYTDLSTEQARELAGKIRKETLSTDELSPVRVLNACYPNDYKLWQGNPSKEHAARWLLWLIEHQPTDAETVILKKFSAQLEAEDISNSILYRASTSSQAKILLRGWLGADENTFPELGEFPLELPINLLNQIKNEWMNRIIVTNGTFFWDMRRFPLPLVLRQELARLTARYYLEHADKLTHAVLHQLDPYLESQILSSLEKHLPPREPSSLPEKESAVLDWFENEYMPYRRWQAQYGDETARKTVVRHAQNFSHWLLDLYPNWLIYGENLTYQKSAHLSSNSPESLTLCIVLDGLPAWDAETLVKDLSARTSRLTLLEETYCFTTIPTITEFAKEALLKGVPPNLVAESSAIGQILPDNRSPVNELSKAQPGQVVFWRVEQPDKTYHFEQGDKRERKVHAELDSIQQVIMQVVEKVPNDLPLQILLTSDHGRLMNPHVPRQLSVPAGYQAHGRVAWGDNDQPFPESGFLINEEENWVELFGERFGLTHNLRIAWGEVSYKTTGGDEPYPHGGLFPEEVIVPWFIFFRDIKPPELEIVIAGEGEADMSGDITVTILNNSPLALECREITFSYGGKLSGNWKITPLNQCQFTITLNPWPPKSAERNMTSSLIFSQPNGVIFTRQVDAPLKINTLYDRPDLLKELDL